MGLYRGKLIAALSVMLVCSAVCIAAEPTTRESAVVPQGKYETQPIARNDAAAARSPASQPAAVLPSAGQLDMGRVALALAIVLGLIFVMRWAGRKFFPSASVPRSGNAMKILSRLAISPKQQLLMIQVGRRIVVVGDAGGQMSPLSEITDAEETAALVAQLTEEKSQQSLKGFGALFHRAEANFEAKTEVADDEKPHLSDSP
jgi:flagellar protein FliO/FliZ